LVLLGGTTMLVGGVGALRQFDAKLILAQGTVSQLGLLMVLVGLGTPGTTYAGVAVFLAHAIFKAALFMGVGVIDHQCHTRDIRRLHGLHRSLPTVVWPMAFAAASMAGLPPTLGFVTKEKALDALLDAEIGAWGGVAVAVVVMGSLFTVAYSARLIWGLTSGWAPDEAHDYAEEPHAPPLGFVAPTLLLGVVSLLGGFTAGPIGRFVAHAAAPLEPKAASKKLLLWPGVNEALALSAIAILGGVLLAVVVIRRSVAATQPLHAPPPRGERAFARAFDSVLVGAKRLTAVTQSGSLPAYVAIVLSVLSALLVAAILRDGGDTWAPQAGGRVPFANSWVEVVLAVVTAGSAIAVLFARRRLEGAILLGASGLGVSMLFMSWGAPDLALTQILIETLSIVMFVLVLRHLPSRFADPPSWAPTAVRFGLSALVGITVAGFGYLASNARTATSVGQEMMARSLSEGGGRNVVNVILVDIRGFDTLGEITVVAVASIGVVNLVAAARREQVRKHLADGSRGPDESGVGDRDASAISMSTGEPS
jgi:multicomponent Na+:H+ antiporter subunit A